MLFLFQSLGDVPNTAIWKYLNDRRVPQLFLGGGLSRWDDPSGHPWTTAWGSSFRDEAKTYARYILQHAPDGKIGILYQNDDYGRDYLHGFKEGLGSQARSMVVSEQTYELTDPTVDSQVVNIRNGGATVFFDVTTPKSLRRLVGRSTI